MKIDLESLTFASPNIPKVFERSSFLAMENRYMDLSSNLILEKETFSSYASELEKNEPLMFNLDDLLCAPSSPAQRSKSPSSVSCANEAA